MTWSASYGIVVHMTGLTLIISDVHEQIRRLVRILKKYEHLVDRVVFLGDFPDTFWGLTEETEETFIWLKEALQNPKYDIVWGNHCLSYAYPSQMMCSGYDKRKQILFNKHLKKSNECLNKVRLFQWVGKWLCSHAGIHPSLIHPVTGFGKEAVLHMEERALMNLQYGSFDPLFRVGECRGGEYKTGGVVWLDFDTEFKPVEGLSQIVGHTRGTKIRWEASTNSSNYCIDTHLRHVAFVDENSKISIVRVYGTTLYRIVKNLANPKLLDLEFSTDEEKSWDIAVGGLPYDELRPLLPQFLLDSNDEFIDTVDFVL